MQVNCGSDGEDYDDVLGIHGDVNLLWQAFFLFKIYCKHQCREQRILSRKNNLKVDSTL